MMIFFSNFRRGSLFFWRPFWSSYRGHYNCWRGHTTFTLNFSWTFANSQRFDVIVTRGFVLAGMCFSTTLKNICLHYQLFVYISWSFIFVSSFKFLQQIAITCWCIKFRPQDHNFLHQSHVFSTISKILSRYVKAVYPQKLAFWQSCCSFRYVKAFYSSKISFLTNPVACSGT